MTAEEQKKMRGLEAENAARWENVNRNKNKVNYKIYCIFEKKQYLYKVNIFGICVLQTNSKKKASSRLRI